MLVQYYTIKIDVKFMKVQQRSISTFFLLIKVDCHRQIEIYPKLILESFFILFYFVQSKADKVN